MRPTRTAILVVVAMFAAPAAALARTAVRNPSQSASQTLVSGALSSNTSASYTPTAPELSATHHAFGPRRPANLAAGRVALGAYAAYLQALYISQNSENAAQANFVARIESGCKSALEPLTLGAGSLSSAVRSTVTVLGEEIGDDLLISRDSVVPGPFARLASTLQALHWIRGVKNIRVINRYVTAERALLSLTTSPLCADIQLAASQPTTTPVNTRLFVKQYRSASDNAVAALDSFRLLLGTYETVAETPLIQHITTLAHTIAALSKNELLSSAQALTTSLETS
ncbi:MAG: hypothetical protein ACP5H2_03635 [Solirubrobacteraceae bacterium]